MKNTIASISGIIFFAALVLIPASAHSQIARPSQLQLGPRFPRHLRSRNPSMQHAQALNHEATASADVIWVQCPAEAQALGATCGQLPVPLDRQHPEKETINIYFELYLHTNPGPAVSAIFANPGGPGLTTTGLRGLIWLPLYGVTLDVHDWVLFDDRGRGSSAAINCSDVQHGTAPFNKAVAECAAQLGAGASAYGTGAIADDAEALRAALGYDKIDYLGGSYGGEDATAYATRYGAHLRSILLDAPAGSPYLPAFAADRGSTSSIPRAIELGCQRSPTCRVDHPDPDSELSALIQS